jgi:hypothetical protein
VRGFGLGEWSGCERVRLSGRLRSRDDVGRVREETVWEAGVGFVLVGRRRTYAYSTYVGRCRKPYGWGSVIDPMLWRTHFI